jgi:DNA-binding HxlR family transcriptional regulator
MPPGNSIKRRSDCPLNISLEIFGDRWTLLIVRDLMLKGRSRFGELLEGGEGIASNILTDRLGRLEAHGLVERRRDPADARRLTYRLTQRGIDLAPVLFEMILWAAQHEETAAPPDEVEAMERDRAGYLAAIRRAWAVTAGD